MIIIKARGRNQYSDAKDWRGKKIKDDVQGLQCTVCTVASKDRVPGWLTLQSQRKPPQRRVSCKSDPKKVPAKSARAASLIRGVTVSDTTAQAPRDQN